MSVLPPPGAGEPALVAVGIDRRAAGVERLAALNRTRRDEILAAWPVPGTGLATLSTCHRLEWYVEARDVEAVLAAYHEWLPAAAPGEPRVRTGRDAAVHLLRVAAGLESAVLGEDQILAQARDAYRAACANGWSAPLLHRVFHAAFRAGRRVRSETTLAAGTRSLAGAAVAALHRRLGGLGGKTVLVLGAGEMARLAVRLLADRNIGRLVVANRTASHAQVLASRYGGETLPWEWRLGVLPVVDGVVAATASPVPVVDAGALAFVSAHRSSPLVVADLGMPPNVADHRVPRVEVFDVEQLGVLLHEEEGRRAAAVADAEAIVEEEAATWAAWHRSRLLRRSCGAARAAR